MYQKDEMREFNDLVRQLLRQLNDSIELSKQASEKLNNIFEDYSLTKNIDTNV